MKIPELSEIKALRKKAGLSQSELSRRSGVSQSLIARIESGSIDPGYSKAASLFRALDSLRRKESPVSGIMSHKVYGVSSFETIEKVARKMKKHNVSQMPVFERGIIVGSVSESTILSQIGSGMDVRDLSRRKVSSCIEDPLPTVNPSTPVSTASVLLENSPAVVVLEKGKVKGIVTKADLLKMVHQ
ncbi:MAG: CBS domain-containing protein [Candidatus Altiarchaeales archaeon]|nr:CBS domain-containing protein [Candidatus Altiarchaeales archaeon]